MTGPRNVQAKGHEAILTGVFGGPGEGMPPIPMGCSQALTLPAKGGGDETPKGL